MLAGIAVGLALALAATRVLQSILFEVSTVDAGTFAVVPLALLAVAALAATLPAERATRAPNVRALRDD